MPSQPSKTLERFSNPHPERDYVVHMDLPEFTCLCPLTGQPDSRTLCWISSRISTMSS
jgi:Enzyme related to GTP cyclohydrolase I